MRVRIRFYGPLQDITGTEEWWTDAPTVREALNQVREQYPAIGEHIHAVAVNRRLVHHDQPLSENDEIDLLPPFTGG